MGQGLRLRRPSIASTGRNGLRSSLRIFKTLTQAIARLLKVDSVGPMIPPDFIITLNRIDEVQAFRNIDNHAL